MPPAGGGADDLAWLAWRYLLDELDTAARAAFEERLGHDEAAAAAFAEATQLLGAVAVAGGGRAPAAPRPRWLPSAVAVAALAAGLLLMTLVAMSPRSRTRPVGRAAELVRLWSGGEESVTAGDADDLAGVAGMEESGLDEVPAWLLTAVAIDHDRRAAAEADDEQVNELL
jgi:hypothetical protein